MINIHITLREFYRGFYEDVSSAFLPSMNTRCLIPCLFPLFQKSSEWSPWFLSYSALRRMCTTLYEPHINRRIYKHATAHDCLCLRLGAKMQNPSVLLALNLLLSVHGGLKNTDLKFVPPLKQIIPYPETRMGKVFWWKTLLRSRPMDRISFVRRNW